MKNPVFIWIIKLNIKHKINRALLLALTEFLPIFFTQCMKNTSDWIENWDRTVIICTIFSKLYFIFILSFFFIVVISKTWMSYVNWMSRFHNKIKTLNVLYSKVFKYSLRVKSKYKHNATLLYCKKFWRNFAVMCHKTQNCFFENFVTAY